MKIESTQKGFTLIELMIVVAIIGILASIAIPQFSSFRAKAFNSAAIADLHSASLAQEALYTDYQRYGGTQTAVGTATTSAGAPLNGSAGFITTTTGKGMPINVSKKVRMVSNCTATTFAAATTISKHDDGDIAYGQETDQAGLYFAKPKPTAQVTTGNGAGSNITITSTSVPGVHATAASLDLTTAKGWTIK